jgi:3-methyladenine DNA glycosylase AlkD
VTRVSTSPAGAHADAFVAAHRTRSRALAARVAALVEQPDRCVAELESAYRELADPSYVQFLHATAPGLESAFGVRAPLCAPLHSAVRRACRGRPDVALWLAERLEREPYLEDLQLACVLLRLSLEEDPERSWQLVRRLARTAGNWIAVDTLAGVAALGILLEPYRWAELELLVYSPSPWERRLVAATIAVLPFEVMPTDRPRLADGPALELLGALIGDAEETVQNALGWALRSWYRVDPAGVAHFVDEHAVRAAAEQDAHRARVLRRALPALDTARAADVHAQIARLRQRRGAPSTSAAARAAAAFADLLAISPAARRGPAIEDAANAAGRDAAPAAPRPTAAPRSTAAPRPPAAPRPTAAQPAPTTARPERSLAQ